jgi:nitroreductase
MNETLKTIHALRTIHGNFSDQEVSETDLHQILEAAVRTANASARQSYSIIVLRDRQVMRELLTYQGRQALVFCVDFSRLMATARYLGHQFNNDDMIGFVTAGIDTALAAQTAVVAAKSLGIDSLITNALHRKPLETVYQMLKLPETSCFPLITVVLGYPREKPAYLKGRLSTEFIVHEGHYQAPDEAQLPRIVAEYDDHDRHLGLIDNWEQQGFEHYLDWFYTKWCGLPDRQRVATGKIQEFQERLAQSGFWRPTA